MYQGKRALKLWRVRNCSLSREVLLRDFWGLSKNYWKEIKKGIRLSSKMLRKLLYDILCCVKIDKNIWLFIINDYHFISPIFIIYWFKCYCFINLFFYFLVFAFSVCLLNE